MSGSCVETGSGEAATVMIDITAFADTVMGRSLISCCSCFAYRQRISAAR